MIRTLALLLASATSLIHTSQSMLDKGPVALTAAFADHKFQGASPLPLRNAQENWAAARQRWQSNAAVRTWVQGRQARMDDWVAHHGDKPEWIAGWGHDLTDLKTGLPIEWSWNMPEPANGTPGEKKIHGAWVMAVREANIRTVADAVRLWKLTGNAVDLDWAARQLDMYAGAYANWPLQTLNGRSQMMGQSLDEATNGIALADAVRIIGNAVPIARRQHWRDGLFRPMLANLLASNRGQNNIAVWQGAAAAVLAVELGDQASFTRAVDGLSGIRAMLARGVTPDYLWFEPSVAYGHYTQQALGTLFSYLSLTNRAAPLRTEMLLTQDMIASQAAMRFADGTLPALGDSVPGIVALDPSLLAVTQRTMPIRASAMPLSWDTLVDPGLPAAPAPPERSSRFWRASQAAMLRRDGWELFTHWGQQSSSHAQGDALSYELRYNGAVISAPAGTANYGSQLFLNYLRTSVAHNQPMIDGEGDTAFGPGTLAKGDATHVEASNPGFGRQVDVSRTMGLDANGASIQTRIAAQGGTHRLGDVFNTACQVTPAGPLTPQAFPQGNGFRWWKNTRASVPSRQWNAMLDCGRARFALMLTANAPGRVFVAAAPDRTGAPVRTAVYFEAPAASALIVNWRIAPR